MSVVRPRRGGSAIRRSPTVLLAIVVIFGALWYAAWPPRTTEGYRGQAEQTVGKFRSEVATAQLWGRELDRDHSFITTVRVGLSEMETDATGNLDQFSAYQPPDALRSMRSDVTKLGDEVVSALGELRIAARSNDAARVVDLSRELDGLLRRIDHLEQEVKS